MRFVRGALPRRMVVGAATAALAISGGLLTQVPAAHADPSFPNQYGQTNLVADQQGKAEIQDTNLLNSFGIASSPTGDLWVSDNHTGLATTYSGAVNGSPVQKDKTVVTIPGGSPTGQVFNPTDDFALSANNMNPAVFIFATEAGRISGWNPDVDPTNAINKVNHPNAIYKGLTLASTASGSRLYAANFSQARVDVFDGMFMPVTLAPGAFRDPQVPKGFAPFNVQAIGDNIYVSFAKQDAAKEDEVDGHGLGYVDAFTTDGKLVHRLAPHGVFNAPWGMVMAPDSFGHFAGAVLVGNFGNGIIHAFDPTTGALLGSLRDEHNHQVDIPNLWALRVGNTDFGGTDAIVFTAGPGDEAHGLIGTLEPVA